MVSAFIAMLAGLVISFVLIAMDRRSVPAALFSVAAASLMVARFYTFDTYYLPTLKRYSDSGVFSSTWVFLVAMVALLASFLCLDDAQSRLRPWDPGDSSSAPLRCASSGSASSGGLFPASRTATLAVS